MLVLIPKVEINNTHDAIMLHDRLLNILKEMNIILVSIGTEHASLLAGKRETDSGNETLGTIGKCDLAMGRISKMTIDPSYARHFTNLMMVWKEST